MNLVCMPVLTEPSDKEVRTEIITLIEDKLSEAYSFTENATHRLPHFEVLDTIFPRWHHGERAKGRQFWVSTNYRAFLVFYRVDYVHIVNGASVIVKGKKLIVWTENNDPKDLEGFWPFQFWAALGTQSNNYLNANYALRYTMKLNLTDTEEWVISEEIVHDKPEMENNLKDHCLYEKQLLDWGLRNYCKKPGLL